MPHYLSVFVRRPAKNIPFLQGDQVSSILNDIYNLVLLVLVILL